MKLLSILLCALITIPAVAAKPQIPPEAIEACQVQSPYGFAQTTKLVVPICRHAYVTAYDSVARLPVWTSYVLTPAHALGCVPRSNAFATDASIANGIQPSDYVGTFYDKGHVAPNGDMSFDQQAESESFLMTNMTAQAPSLNRGIWKLLETSIRGWAVQLNQPFVIYAGPLYGPDDFVTRSGVHIPHGFYKIVVNGATGATAGWVFPHVKPYPNLGDSLIKFRMPIVQIQQLSGVTFAFPSNATELQPGTEWPVNFSQLISAKRKQCGIATD